MRPIGRSSGRSAGSYLTWLGSRANGGTDEYAWPVALLKIQKNELFELIRNNGLQPTDCQMTSIGENVTIKHVPTDSTFLIIPDKSGSTFFTTSRIGSTPNHYSTFSMPWDIVRGRFRDWTEAIKVEIDDPDMWEELRHQHELLGGAQYESLENTPFTTDEQREISNQLREIKEVVKKTYSLTNEQMSGVEARLDDIEAASRRMGRKDWLLLFLGGIVTLVIAGLVSPDIAQHILDMGFHSLDHLFGAEAPPQIPPQA
jgi:hypothetical protein